ncbi:MAG: hypothetical protein Q9210_002515 [Variospora velana]
MGPHELAMRTFTIILHADNPHHTRLLEVPERESWNEFLIRLQEASRPIARTDFPPEANKNGLTMDEGHWWFALHGERAPTRGTRMYMRNEWSYEWMKDKLLKRDIRWKAALIRHPADTEDGPADVEDNKVPSSPSSQARKSSPELLLLSFRTHQLHIYTLGMMTLKTRTCNQASSHHLQETQIVSGPTSLPPGNVLGDVSRLVAVLQAPLSPYLHSKDDPPIKSWQWRWD